MARSHPFDVELRRASVPTPAYPAELPITAQLDALREAISRHQVVIVAGATGSGKTTQLPKLCLELGRGVEGMIGHTQPRRVAARTVAERIAEELGVELGRQVGYAVRFTDRVSDTTLVKVMTDGILLAELQRDRLLRRYDTLIIDEAHERSLNIDFLLGYVKQLLPRRPDLKVVITSATIDTERFSTHFGDAPVVEVEGRAFPVDIRYAPIDEDSDPTQAVCDAVDELCAGGPGDVLVFLSGEREIRDTADALTRDRARPIEVLPLYARLSPAEQHRVFEAHTGRRVILATNVAETSLTVPGVRSVVDPGTARISRFNRRTKMQRLPIEPVSQASANQRSGRCGRVGPGICIRLYSEEDFEARPEYTDPEILRTNLASVILQMLALDLGAIADFPFIDPPDGRAVKDGMLLLEELGALTPATQAAAQAPAHAPQLTPIGRRLSRLPLDPRLGRMIIEAERLGCLAEMLVITSGLAIQDPRLRPPEHQQAAAEMHARFADPGSDFLAYLNLWRHVQDQQRSRSSSAFRRMCRAEYLNYLRVREWQDLHGQLRGIAKDLGMRVRPEDAKPGRKPDAKPDAKPGRKPDAKPDAPERAKPAAIHQALLAGLLSHIGHRDAAKQDYQGARGARFTIAPGSALAKGTRRWVMVAELVETDRARGRVAAGIEPAWAERIGSHLVTRTYGDPWWDRGRATALVDERVTLMGLTLVAARPVELACIDQAQPEGRAQAQPEGRAEARELFIQHALVEGDWDAGYDFIPRNGDVIDELRRLEHRKRQSLVDGEDVLFDFYDQRIPADVGSGPQFDRWWKHNADRSLLDVTITHVPDIAEIDPEAFPDTWHQGELDLPVSYVFEPGAPDDGVTVDIAIAVLNQVDPEGFDWQVPGHRDELVAALIRSLPKALRRSFVPAPDYARTFLAEATPADGPLTACLEARLPLLTGDPLPPGNWQWDRVPDHLRITFRVVDDSGRVLAEGKDLDALKHDLHRETSSTLSRAAASVERTGLTVWSIGHLPERLELRRGAYDIVAFPALVDEGTTVGVRVFATEGAQAASMWNGTRRLILLSSPPRGSPQRSLSNQSKLALSGGRYGTIDDILGDATDAAVDKLIADHGGTAWDATAFDALRAAVAEDLADTTTAVVVFVARIVTAATALTNRLDTISTPRLQPAVDDIRAQIAALVAPGFATRAGASRLPDVLRYVRAADRRLDKLAEDPTRDRRRMEIIQDLITEARGIGGDVPWMIEELRVSSFAQVLGARGPVSPERIRREIARLRS